MTPQVPVPRVRQSRAVANDERILDAAEAILAEDGWEEASVLRVAERAGLSRRAVLSRYGDRAGIVSAVWTARLAAPLLVALEGVIATQNAPGSDRGLSNGLAPLMRPSPQLRAAAEVLIVASFQGDVNDAVLAALREPLDTWLTPNRKGLTRSRASRNVALLGLALGVLVETRSYPDITDFDVATELGHVAWALQQEVAPHRLPATRAAYLEAEPILDPDPGMAAMLAAVLRLVGRDGYEAATVDRIAAECGRTSGFIFGHYRNKRDLFLDASERALAQAEEASEAFLDGLSQSLPPGIADAVLTREIMRPDFRGLRTNTLEQYRLSWHDDDFLAAFLAPRTTYVQRIINSEPGLSLPRARGRAFIGLARGIGYALLAQLSPDIYALPHDVVSVPLIDR